MATPTTGKPPPQAHGAPGHAADPSRPARRNVPRLGACLSRPPGTPGRPPAAHKASWIRGGSPRAAPHLPGQGHPPSGPPHLSLRRALSRACPLHTQPVLTPHKPAASSPHTRKQTCSLLQTGVHKPSFPCSPLEHLLSWATPPADRSVPGTSNEDPQGSSAHHSRQAAAGGF